VDTPTALIADENTNRANRLRKLLGEAGFACESVHSAAEIVNPADVLFVAGDTPGIAGSDELVERFAQCTPDALIVVMTEAPLWELITLAVRKRAWMDVPQTEQYNDLLARYAISRSPRPKIIMEDSAARRDQLLSQWQSASQSMPDLQLASSLGEALELAIDSRVAVLLNFSISPGAAQTTGISTLVYSLCPAVIAVMLEAYNGKQARRNLSHIEPNSRFALLKPPFSSSDIGALLNTTSVGWPLTSTSPP
jgi:hypothetical protein